MTRALRQPCPPRPSAFRLSRRRGFTLIEAAWVTVIVGVGAIAMMELLATGTAVNGSGTEMTTAINLANNVHEIALGLAFADPENKTVWSSREASVAAYDNITDLDGQTFGPGGQPGPLDVRRQPIADCPNWAQRVKVETVALDTLSSVRPNSTSVPTARVTVDVLRNNKVVHTATWLVVGPGPG